MSIATVTTTQTIQPAAPRPQATPQPARPAQEKQALQSSDQAVISTREKPSTLRVIGSSLAGAGTSFAAALPVVFLTGMVSSLANNSFDIGFGKALWGGAALAGAGLVTGATVGHVTESKFKGSLIGAAIGGATGAIYGGLTMGSPGALLYGLTGAGTGAASGSMSVQILNKQKSDWTPEKAAQGLLIDIAVDQALDAILQK